MQRKIDYEIVVDCYEEEEVNMAWYIYLDENLEFPFEATAQLKKTDGSTEQKKVKVVAVANHDEGIRGKDFDVEIELRQHICKIEFSKLRKIKASPQTQQALAIWKYWLERW